MFNFGLGFSGLIERVPHLPHYGYGQNCIHVLWNLIRASRLKVILAAGKPHQVPQFPGQWHKESRALWHRGFIGGAGATRARCSATVLAIVHDSRVV